MAAAPAADSLSGPLRVVGVMSGTSVDGIDVAVCSIATTSTDATDRPRFSVTLEGFHTEPWHPDHRKAVMDIVRDPHATVPLRDIGRLHFDLGAAFAVAIRRSLEALGTDIKSIDVIASHGQTVFHDPPRSTLQLGEGSVIADNTGATTVSNFRAADVAAGGQGAPLTSTYDWNMLRPLADAGGWRGVQNIGGIANVTLLPPYGNAAGAAPIAFDNGPGNVFIDMAATDCDSRLRYDDDGKLAASGTVSPELLEHMLSLPYFAEKPPKTTGRELFCRALYDEWKVRADELGLSGPDFVATVTELTAVAIVQSYKFCPGGVGAVSEMVVGGGGSRNPVLMQRLQHHLALAHAASPQGADAVDIGGASESEGAGGAAGEGAGSSGGGVAPARVGAKAPRVVAHEELGINSDAKEAMAFALLGYLAIHGYTGNVPACTGASAAKVLGQINPGDNYGSLLAKVTPR